MVLANLSTGYVGDITPGVQWARTHSWFAGQRYGVLHSTYLRVSAAVAGTRQVTIGDGFAYGYGIIDYWSSDSALSLPAVTSGTNYFLVGILRTWGTTKAACSSDLTYIDAGAAGATTIPTRPIDYGNTTDFQPLAMVPVIGNSSGGVVGDPIDLRVIGAENGDRYIFSELALQYLAVTGTVVWLGNVRYRRRVKADSSGTEWVKDGPYVPATDLKIYKGSAVLTTADAPDISGAGMTIEGYIDGNVRDVYFELRHSGASDLKFDEGNGSIDDHFLFQFTAPFTPRTIRVLTVQYLSLTGATFDAVCHVTDKGKVYLASGSPNTSVKQGASGEWCIRGTFTFINPTQ